jgi:hypothetical protein
MKHAIKRKRMLRAPGRNRVRILPRVPWCTLVAFIFMLTFSCDDERYCRPFTLPLRSSFIEFRIRANNGCI